MEKMKTSKLYYDTGELRYIGIVGIEKIQDTEYIFHCCKGIEFYKNGTVKQKGTFQKAGLLKGKVYYPNGKLKFYGIFNNKSRSISGGYSVIYGHYYGPSYPIYGKFYDENGTIIYKGKFIVEFQGSVAYPKIIYPKNYGSLG